MIVTDKKFRPVTAVMQLPIRGYRKFLSPILPARCRYYPSCSSYAMEALTVHGPIKGTILGAWRIARCNPWSLGGVDHVPEKGAWKPEEWVPPEDWPGHSLREAKQEAARLEAQKKTESE